MTAPIEQTREAGTYKTLYSLTGDIKDINTLLVPRSVLAEKDQGPPMQPVADGYGLAAFKCGACGQKWKHPHLCPAKMNGRAF